MWTVDSHDWAEEIRGTKVTKNYLVSRVLDNATDGGIILMHVGGYHTVEALPEIITGLKNKGYEIVTVNSMLPKPQNYEYTVIKGDTLYSTSLKYGVSVEDIQGANNMK
jgi:peptidoglycan/xylan/chitin deacetylase (PgdA/CDA1 family)